MIRIIKIQLIFHLLLRTQIIFIAENLRERFPHKKDDGASSQSYTPKDSAETATSPRPPNLYGGSENERLRRAHASQFYDLNAQAGYLSGNNIDQGSHIWYSIMSVFSFLSRFKTHLYAAFALRTALILYGDHKVSANKCIYDNLYDRFHLIFIKF